MHLTFLRPRWPRAAGTVGARPAAAPRRLVLDRRLLLAESFDQHAAAFAVGHEAGAFLRGSRGLRPVRVASAAIVPPQRRVVLPPGIAAARPARRLGAALGVAPA